MAYLRAWLGLALLVALFAPSVVFGAAPTVTTYTKAFTVSATGGTQCGASFQIPITDSSGMPLSNWMISTGGTGPVTTQASIYSIGITPTIAVPSGQWNFLGASVTAGGLTGRMIPKGAFASSCGQVAADASNNELITITVDENTGASPFFAGAGTATTVFPVANGAAQSLPPAVNGHYLPSPLNKFDPINNPNPVWASVPFFPVSATLDATTVLATLNIDTSLSQYPVCWNTVTVTVTVVLCPTYTLMTSFPEVPALAPYVPPVNEDESYRGSFITWRQWVSTSATSDQVQVDIVTSWAKGTWSSLTQAQISTKLSTIRLDVFTVPSAGNLAQDLITTSLQQLDLAAGITPTIGTLWGGLSSLVNAANPEISFPWDSTDSNVLSYDTYVKSMILTIPGRTPTAGARQVRVVVSGCCHPTAMYFQNGNTVATPVLSAGSLPYSIEAVMTLESPTTAAGAANPQYPRTSPELFVPPLVFLGGSPATGASPDQVAFGGFVPATNAEANTVYTFPITEVAVGNGGNTLLQNPTTAPIKVTADTVPRGFLFSVSMLAQSALSPSGFVLPEPLTGTTARGVLTQTSGGNVISTTSYDFIALRRATNFDTSVNEGATCNNVPGTLWDAYPKGSSPNPNGISARSSAGTVGYVGGNPLEWGFVFSQNQQCGNQLDVKPLRTGSTVAQSQVLSFTTSRSPNTPYPALFFLAMDTNQNILPVYYDAPTANFPDTPQALAGLEVLAVSQIGFPKRTVPVSQQYPTGTKLLTRERMGISYCYSRAVFKCDGVSWATAGGNVALTPPTCVSPATDTTCADGSVTFTTPAATARGNANYVFIVVSVDSSSGATTILGSTTVAPGSTGTVPGLKVLSATSVVSWYTQDPAGCLFSGTLLLESGTNNKPTSVTVGAVTQPVCTSGNPVGGSVTVVFTSPSFNLAGQTATFTFSSGAVNAPGQLLTGTATVALVSGSTYSFNTGPVVGGPTALGTNAVLSVTVASENYKLSVPFTSSIGFTTPLSVAISINNGFLAIATPSAPVASYQWTLNNVVQPVTTATLQLDATGANAGQTLAVVVTTASGCTATTNVVVPGAGTSPTVKIGATVTNPVFTDSCYSVVLSFTGMGGVPPNTNLAVSWRYCAQSVNLNAGTQPTAANCQTWSNWVNMVCPKLIGIQSSTPQLPLPDGVTPSGYGLLQFQAATIGGGTTAFGSATVTVNYNAANALGSWVANGLARPPNCGSTTCTAGQLHT